jgi:hypothetical protein
MLWECQATWRCRSLILFTLSLGVNRIPPCCYSHLRNWFQHPCYVSRDWKDRNWSLWKKERNLI